MLPAAILAGHGTGWNEFLIGLLLLLAPCMVISALIQWPQPLWPSKKGARDD